MPSLLSSEKVPPLSSVFTRYWFMRSRFGSLPEFSTSTPYSAPLPVFAKTLSAVSASMSVSRRNEPFPESEPIFAVSPTVPFCIRTSPPFPLRKRIVLSPENDQYAPSPRFMVMPLLSRVLLSQSTS